MNKILHEQPYPFYETVGLLSIASEPVSDLRRTFIEELEELGLNGAVLYDKYMGYFEIYVKTFQENKKPEPEDAFWINGKSDNLSYILTGFLLKLSINSKLRANNKNLKELLIAECKEIEEPVRDVPVETNRPDTIMKMVEQMSVPSEDKLILLKILLDPAGSVPKMLTWIQSNIEAYHTAHSAIASESKELISRNLKYMENTDNWFRSLIDGLSDVRHIYPSLVTPLAQIAFGNLGFSGVLCPVLDISDTKEETFDETLFAGLKALADTSKLEILRRLKKQPMYNHQIAEELKLTAATVSYHMNTMLAWQLVTAKKESGKIYYYPNTAAIELLLKRVRSLLLE